MQFKVPQDVQQADRIMYFLTLPQLIMCVVGFGIAYGIYTVLHKQGLSGIFWFPPVFIVGAITIAFAFVKIANMPFYRFLAVMVERFLLPSKRVWVKGADRIVMDESMLLEEDLKAKQKAEEMKSIEEGKQEKLSQLDTLTSSIDTADARQAVQSEGIAGGEAVAEDSERKAQSLLEADARQAVRSGGASEGGSGAKDSERKISEGNLSSRKAQSLLEAESEKPALQVIEVDRVPDEDLLQKTFLKTETPEEKVLHLSALPADERPAVQADARQVAPSPPAPEQKTKRKRRRRRKKKSAGPLEKVMSQGVPVSAPSSSPTPISTPTQSQTSPAVPVPIAKPEPAEISEQEISKVEAVPSPISEDTIPKDERVEISQETIKPIHFETSEDTIPENERIEIPEESIEPIYSATTEDTIPANERVEEMPSKNQKPAQISEEFTPDQLKQGQTISFS